MDTIFKTSSGFKVKSDRKITKYIKLNDIPIFSKR